MKCKKNALGKLANSFTALLNMFTIQYDRKHYSQGEMFKNEMNPSKNKPVRFLHFWNPQDLYITFLHDNIK